MIKDTSGRTFKSLRVSLTQKCNLACVYCVSDDTPHIKSIDTGGDFLITKLKEIEQIHQLCTLEEVRLTGGEPLLYADLGKLIVGLKQLGIPKVTLTSNAYLLERSAKSLYKAGLDSVNISLDAINPEVFLKITRRKQLSKVLNGIDEAVRVGLKVKLNAVIMKGVNEQEVVPLFLFAKDRNITLRYLEIMRMGYLNNSFKDHFYSQEEIINDIQKIYTAYPLEREKSATATYWMTDTGYQFGVIANETAPFCADCNRLRLDHKGNVYGCLSENKGLSIVDLQDEDKLASVLKKAIEQKQEVRFKGSDLSMQYIGG